MRTISTLFLALALAGCKTSPPTTGTGKVVSCATDAVRGKWPVLIGPTNTCLTLPDGENWTSCLLGLISPAAGITQDVLACVLRDQGTKFGESAQRNPNDVRSARAADRADRFLMERGFKFAE